MNYKSTTMIPNAVFDMLNTLSEKELKVLLIILRETIGWVSKKRKADIGYIIGILLLQQVSLGNL